MAERQRFEREIADLGLREYDQGPPAPTPREVVVGEQVVLDVTQHPRFSLRGAGVQWTVQWTVPGTAVKSYKGDVNSARVTKLELRENPLAFYWVDAAAGRKVKVRVTYTSVTAARSFVDEFVYATFDVKGPKLDYFKCVTSLPKLTPKNGIWSISFGDKKGKAGIAWDWQITMPEGHAGSLKDIQLVKRGRRKTQLLDPSGKTRKLLVMMDPGGDKGYLLDIGTAGEEECTDLNAWREPKYSFVQKVAAGNPFPDAFTFDIPSDNLLPLDVRYTVDEHFQYYILFKPDKANAIWVPVAKAEWFWKADAVRKGSKWNFNSRSGGIKKGGKGAPTTKFPLYKTNTCANQWCVIKADGSIDC